MVRQKNPAMDLLRILAAAMVLGVHVGQKAGLGEAAAVGARGVELFFILSGYLTAVSLEHNGDPVTYYKRRVQRILPLYWLVLVLRWVFDALRCFASGMSAAEVFSGPCGPRYLRYFFFLQMWLPSEDWSLWNNRNVLWTMSAFAFFYLIAPLLYKVCRRFRNAMAVLLVCLAGKGLLGQKIESCLSGWPEEAHISQFSAQTPLMTIYCFVFGMAVLAAVRENRQFVFGAFCLLLAAVFGFERCAYECVFAVLVLLAAQYPPKEIPEKGRKLLNFFSAGSFWLYLAHPMVLELLPAWQGWGGLAALFVAVAAICYLLYALVIERYEHLFVGKNRT